MFSMSNFHYPAPVSTPLNMKVLHVAGGRDDAKLSIPATVILRYMFMPAEMRVI